MQLSGHFSKLSLAEASGRSLLQTLLPVTVAALIHLAGEPPFRAGAAQLPVWIAALMTYDHPFGSLALYLVKQQQLGHQC